MFIDALNNLKARYMLTGSLASNMYGNPRGTQDADFVLDPETDTLSQVAARVTPTYELDPQAYFESVTMTTRYVFHAQDHEFKAEFFLLSNDAHDKERFRRRRLGHFENRPVNVPSPEDVVVAKLRWILRARRPKDIGDVKSVLATQQNRLDWDYIRHWCEQHGTWELATQIRDSIPPL